MATITSRVLQVAITVKSAMSAIWPEGPDGLPVWAPEAREILENRLKFSCGYAAQTSELWGHPAIIVCEFVKGGLTFLTIIERMTFDRAAAWLPQKTVVL